MKKLVMAITAALALLMGAPAWAAPRAEVEVKGIACPFCAYGLEKKVKAVEGVAGAQVDLAAGLLHVKGKEGARLDAERLKAAVRASGFSPGEVRIEEDGG